MNATLWVKRQAPSPQASRAVGRRSRGDRAGLRSARRTECPEVRKPTTSRLTKRRAVSTGPEKFGRFVVIEFPSMEKAIACHDSAEYQDASAFRKGGGGEVELVIVDAGDPTPT